MLPGTKIGEYSIVGGGGLVANDIPQHTIAVGIPARPTRSIGRRVDSGPGARFAVTARLLSVDDPWWRRVFAETEHDIYHRPEYARADAGPHEHAMAVWLEVAGCLLLVPFWGAMVTRGGKSGCVHGDGDCRKAGCVSASRSTTWVDEPTTRPEHRA